MELRVFDENRNPTSIKYKDILSVKIVNRRLCYLTTDGFTYYGSVNLKEWAELHEKKGMFQIDKNCVINTAHIKHVIKGIAYGTGGKKYTIARRNRTKFLENWNDPKK